MNDCAPLYVAQDFAQSLCLTLIQGQLKTSLRRLAIRGETTKAGNFGDGFLMAIVMGLRKLRELLVTPTFLMTQIGIADAFAWLLLHQNPGKAPLVSFVLPGVFVDADLFRFMISQQAPFLPDCFNYAMSKPALSLAHLHLQFAYTGPGEFRESAIPQPGDAIYPVNRQMLDGWFEAFNQLNGALETAFYDDREDFQYENCRVSYTYY